MTHRWLAFVLLAASLATGCAGSRYLGSIGRTGVYSNRGYGMTVDTSTAGLSSRFVAIDPLHLEAAPPEHRPRLEKGLLDINGDGALGLGEDVGSFTVPTLRLYRDGPEPMVRIDVDVQIMGGDDAKRTLNELFERELDRLRPVTTSTRTPRVVRDPFARHPAFTEELSISTKDGPRDIRLTLMDGGYFAAEEGGFRRQVVKVLMVAHRLEKELRADHQRLVSGILLARSGAAPSAKERW